MSSVSSDFIPTDRQEKEAILELAKQWYSPFISTYLYLLYYI